MRLVLASNNPGKLVELQALLAPLAIELVAQSALGVDEAEEPHVTFLENALAKARHAARAASGAAIADDSGLCVDALGGAPGVASAHFAAIEKRPDDDREAHRRRQDEANNASVLAQLRGHRDRRARFVSTLVAVRRHDDPEPLVAVGRWEGEVLESPRGSGGFGYDPLLYLPSFGRTVAELDRDTKNRMSHRAEAARAMLVLMRVVWGLRDPASQSASGR
ncbi:MAG: RdgB/HAM1 family non-canonical purine NTP pyrophosphatase [Caldimonas sp.]